MKYNNKFKTIFVWTWMILYVLGMGTWILKTWWMYDRGFGPEPLPVTNLILHLHAIIGLWFLLVFGYLFHMHIQPSWRQHHPGQGGDAGRLVKGQHGKLGFSKLMKLNSGNLLFLTICILILTVPGLLYLSSEIYKNWVTQVHVILGLFSLVPVIFHMRLSLVKKPN